MINKCVIFDLDGTLIDSREDLADSVNLMLAEYGRESLPVDLITSFVGNGSKALVERALQGFKTDIGEAAKLMKSFYLKRLVNKTYLYDGVVEGLEKLYSKGWKLGLISNKPQVPTQEILQHFGLEKYFSCIIGGDNKFPLKPDPASIVHVIETTNSSVKGSWIFGDNYTDLEAGRRAGLQCGFAKYGFGRQGSEIYDIATDSFLEFIDFLQK